VAGYWPLPLPPRKKASPPEGYTGRNGRRVDPADVDRWITENRSGNIGLRLPRGVIGIDVDAYKDEHHVVAWEELIARYGPLPDAPWCSSRDDGVSGVRLFRVPEDWEAAGKLPEASNGVSPGEVIQWHHRYVVCPPSIHPDSGRAYRWRSGSITNVADLPELPQPWLAPLGAATASTRQDSRRVTTPPAGDPVGVRPGDDFNERADWLSDILGPHGWQRHHESGGTLYVTRPGKSTREGHSATIGHSKDGVERLYVFSADAAPFEPETPYSKFSAYALLNHGGNHQAAARELGRMGFGSPLEPADPAAGDDVPWPSAPAHAPSSHSDDSDNSGTGLSESPQGRDQQKEPHSDNNDSSYKDDGDLLAAVRDGAWLTEQKFPPLRYAIGGLIPEGLTIKVGPPKAGKSWLILGLLLAIAAGGVALGRVATGKPRRVLYLALEDGDRRMQARCRALLGEHRPIPELFCYLTRATPQTVLPVIHAWMKRYPDTAMIVIDTLGKVMPPALQGESSYQRDYRVGSALKRVADDHPGLSVVVLHHDRKAAAEDFVDSVSATHGLAGAADTVIVLSRKRQSDEGLLQVTGRDVEETEYAIKMEAGDWQLEGATLAAAAAAARSRQAEQNLSVPMADVLRFVGQHQTGVRAKEVAAKFGDSAYQYLKRLHEMGRIEKLSRGIYVPLPSEQSEQSEQQVRGSAESDSADSEVSETPSGPALIAQRDPDVPNPRPDCRHPACWDALQGECLAGRGLCLTCGTPLDPKTAAAGITVHPNCEEASAA
jgi:RecA-family ATPase